MTGDNKRKGTKLREKRSSSTDDDELQPVGPGPLVVHNISKKMSIYGPNFLKGPTKLRIQRLLEKERKKADAIVDEHMKMLEAQFKAAEEKQRLEQLELIKKQQPVMGKKRVYDEKKNQTINQIQNVNQFQSNLQWQDLPLYPEEFEQFQLQQYQQEFPMYQHELLQFQQFTEFSQFPVYQHYQQYPQQNNYFVYQS
ncbi:unnamed protein product [Caenorhabditis brenneri]